LDWLEEFYPGQAQAAEGKGLDLIALKNVPESGGCTPALVAKAGDCLREQRQRLEAVAKEAAP
jgi:hypothetical protein